MLLSSMVENSRAAYVGNQGFMLFVDEGQLCALLRFLPKVYTAGLPQEMFRSLQPVALLSNLILKKECSINNVTKIYVQ